MLRLMRKLRRKPKVKFIHNKDIKYTERELKQLRDRWRKVEADAADATRDIKDSLIEAIKANRDWQESKAYELVKAAWVKPFPEVVAWDLRGIELIKLDLSGAFLERANLSGALLGSVNLSEADLKGAIFFGADLNYADLTGADLRATSLNRADLRGANLSEVQFLEGVSWKHKDKLWAMVKRWDFTGENLKPSERRTLFGSNDIRNTNWAGAALLKRYVEDENFLTEYIQSAAPRLKIRSWRSWCSSFPRLPRKIWLWIWKCTCDYGRSFWRWAIVSALSAVVFAILYWSFGCERIAFNVDRLKEAQPDFWSYLYYSVVTFTTLGFGDIVPLTNWARLAVGAEVFIGYVMLGGLISIFANKLARRA